MRISNVLLLTSLVAETLAARFSGGAKQKRFVGKDVVRPKVERRAALVSKATVTPKFFILSLFSSEGDIWLEKMPSLYKQNISVPGISPLFPYVHCFENGNVCQVTLGEGEINAAASLAAIVYSGLFNLTKTYFMVAGIAGINPHVATTGSVTFSRYAVQFDLQYEFDSRQISSNYSSGYFPQDSNFPDETNAIDYPGEIYGTEAFELNVALRNRFLKIASTNVTLADSKAAQKYRATYGYAPANKPPAVVACDTGTSNVYWSGSTLGDAFSAYTKLLTNGSATYCATQQEDNAIAEVLLRADVASKVDYARLAVMRTASDFDRAPPGETEVYHLLQANQEGFEISILNLYNAGHPIIRDVLENWDDVYGAGIKAPNYIGDLFNTLDKPHPDIGTESIYIN